VVDEAHQILSQRTFRAQFAKVKELAPFQVQKIYITGSLPIRHERRFLLEAGLSYSTKIIRSPTHQPQISYNLFKVSSMTTNAVRLAIDIAKFMETLMEPNHIGIIFSKSKSEVDELHKKFTKCSSHSDLTTSDRGHNETSWLNGFHRWIAATTGLIHGIDSPKVGVIIFIGQPFGLINLYQGSGRAGRDGQKAWVIIIDFVNINQICPSDFAEDLECVTECLDLLERQDCHRLPFSETLDGQKESCLDLEGAHLCNVCDPDSIVVAGITPLLLDPLEPIPDEEEMDEYDKYNESMEMNIDFEQLPFFESDIPTQSRATFVTETQTAVPSSSIPSTPDTQVQPLLIAPSHLIPPSTNVPSSQVKRAVSLYHRNAKTLSDKSLIINQYTSKLAGKCVLCWAYQGFYNPRHMKDLWRSCKGHGQYVRGNWIAFKKLFHFEKYKFCFQCFLPQGDYLPPSHPMFQANRKDRKPCPLEDFVVLLLYFIRNEREWWNKARGTFPDMPAQPNEQEYARWCQVVEKSDNFYNGLELVVWFLFTYRPVQR